jgi:hypothetical protein
MRRARRLATASLEDGVTANHCLHESDHVEAGEVRPQPKPTGEAGEGHEAYLHQIDQLQQVIVVVAPVVVIVVPTSLALIVAVVLDVFVMLGGSLQAERWWSVPLRSPSRLLFYFK